MVKKLAVIGAGFGVLLATAAPAMSAQTWQEIYTGLRRSAQAADAQIRDSVLVQENKVVTSQGTIPSRITTYRRGARFRTESTLAMEGSASDDWQASSVVIGDGRDTWMVSEYGAQKVGASRKTEQGGGWWTAYDRPGAIVGEETIGDRRCVVIELTPSKQSTITKLWIDPADYAIVRTEGFGPDQKMVTVAYSDFRQVVGTAPTAFCMDIYENGSLSSSLVTLSAKINTGFGDELFDVRDIAAENAGRTRQKLQSETESDGADRDRQSSAPNEAGPPPQREVDVQIS